MMNCPTCKTIMEVAQFHCTQCNLNLQGHFHLPRLARLSQEHMKLAEAFLLSSGNLKHLAEQMQISYPTLRRRMDGLFEELQKIVADDRITAEKILAKIETGSMSAQEGLRLIQEMNGEA